MLVSPYSVGWHLLVRMTKGVCFFIEGRNRQCSHFAATHPLSRRVWKVSRQHRACLCSNADVGVGRVDAAKVLVERGALVTHCDVAGVPLLHRGC